MTYAFTNSARQHIVGPITGSAFLIRCEIRRDKIPGKVIAFVNDCSRSQPGGQRRHSWRLFIAFGMTTETSINCIHHVSPAFKTGGGYFEGSVAEGSNLRSDKWPPTDCKSDAQQKYCNDNKHSCAYSFLPTTRHNSSSTS